MDEPGDKPKNAAESPIQIGDDACKLANCQDTSGNPLPPSKESRKLPKKNKNKSVKGDENKQVSDGVAKPPYMLMKEPELEDFIALSDNKGSTFHYNKKVLKELETDDFIVLHIKELEDSSNYLAAFFLCELCAVEMVYLEECNGHINTKSHRKLKKVKGDLVCVSKLPPPSEHHTLALSRLLDSVFVEHGLCPDTDLPLRKEIAETVHKAVSARHPECAVSLYGSSLTGFGLKSSDVNLDLSIPEEVKVPPILLSILDLLQNDERFCDVTEDFDAKVPCITLKHESSGLTCELSPGNVTASNTSCLLKKYGEYDNRVRTLVVGLRHWARVCSVDCQSEGTLPGYSFALIVIQFLQETKPPVLPRWSPWHVVHEENFNVDEGFKRLNNDSTGSLWLQLFRFYCIDFNIEHWVISVKHAIPLTRESKKWGHRRLAVEDPFSLKRNVASSLSSDKAFDYFFGCLKTSYLYFRSFPGASENGPVTPAKEVHSNHASVTSKEKETQRRTSAVEQKANLVKNDEDIFQLDDVDLVATKVESVKLDDDSDHCEVDEETDVLAKGGDRVKGVQPCVSESESVCITNSNTAATVGETTKANSSEARINQLEPSNLAPVHIFDASILRGKRQPIKTCCYCKHDGHVKSQCPELRKPTLKKLPQVPPRFRVLLDRVCMTCRADFQFNWNEVEYREKVLRNLESYIREVYPDARLFLFGSSKNGFGFRTSDIDICMTLDAHVREDIDFVQVITTLAKLLKKHKDCGNVLAITTAKVPIVKFYLRSCKREADISLYNTLALENTRMLATYARLEDRLVTLGYTVKVFAKVCEIGDASKGSLSSYAYILMLLHYLQQQNVIPVLQTLYPDGQPPPEKNIEGWNCWFFEDLSNIKSVWNPKPKNTATVGSLWLGFLRYYTEEFDFEHDVVCCRRKKKLTKFEKMWTKHVFAIEDPFNLDHNLGAGVTRKMASYIFTTFVRGRERFGVPVYDLHPEVTQQYFFDVYFLTDGCEAPTDRNCRVCGKIGHFAKDCPLSKSNRRAEQKKEEAEREAGENASDNYKSNNKPFNAGPTRPRSASAPNKQRQESDGRHKGGLQPESTTADSEKIGSIANKAGETKAITSPAQNKPTAHVAGVVTPSTQREPEPLIHPLSLPSPISQTMEQVKHSQQGELEVGAESSCPEVSSQSAVTSSDVTGEIAMPVCSTEEVELVPKKGPGLTQSLPTPRAGAERHGKRVTNTTPPLSYVQASPVVSIPVRHCHTSPVTSHPMGFYAQGSVPQASMIRSPHLSSNITLSRPLNASPSSWHQRQPVVLNTPPENHWCSQQMRPHLGSPAAHEMWLRQQRGVLVSPVSPPVRLQHRSDPEGLLMSHGHRSWNLAEQAHPMIPRSPPTISRNVMWPVSSSSPPQVPGSYPGASPGRGQSPPMPGHQPGFPHGHHSVVGSPEHSPQLPVPRQPSPAQLALGAHMTGEQFIDLMRTVEETSQRSEETRQTKMPSGDAESNNTQHIPSKELKVAKTPEERQLLSKLNKVRSLWERGAVDETNEQVSESENTNAGSQLEVLVATEEVSQALSGADLQCSAQNESPGISDDESGASSKVETMSVEGTVKRQMDAKKITVSCESNVKSKDETGVSLNREPLDEVKHSQNSDVVLAEQQLQAAEEKTEVNGFKARETNGEKNNALPLTREGDVSRSKSRRRGGRNHRNRGPRKAEEEARTPEKRAKQVAQDVKDSSQSSHQKRNYDDFKDESLKVSPLAKKPKGGRWEGPKNPGRGLNARVCERNAHNEDSPLSKKGKSGTAQNRGHEVPSGKASKFHEDRSKEVEGKASGRGYGKPRSRTKSGGYAGDKGDTRRRSSSTPQKQ